MAVAVGVGVGVGVRSGVGTVAVAVGIGLDGVVTGGVAGADGAMVGCCPGRIGVVGSSVGCV